jgi:hypothetical protein
MAPAAYAQMLPSCPSAPLLSCCSGSLEPADARCAWPCAAAALMSPDTAVLSVTRCVCCWWSTTTVVACALASCGCPGWELSVLLLGGHSAAAAGAAAGAGCGDHGVRITNNSCPTSCCLTASTAACAEALQGVPVLRRCRVGPLALTVSGSATPLLCWSKHMC